MAVTATATYLLCNTVAQDDSVGTQVWAFPDNIKTDANDVPNLGWATNFASFDFIELYKAHLVVDGVIQTATNKGTGQDLDPYPGSDLVLGGTSDLWSATLTPAKVKAQDFGVAVAWGDVNNVGTAISYYLEALGFDFAIPDSATIVGVQAKIDANWYPVGGGGMVAVAVDDIQMQITFSYDPEIIDTGYSYGACYVEDTGQPLRQKIVRYLISSPQGVFLGEWKDVTSDLEFKQELNNALSSITVSLARNELTLITVTDFLLTESGDKITTESDLAILADLAAATGLGAGTDLETNHNVDIVVYWGAYEPLLTEDGFPIYTEDFRTIFVTDSSPEGQTVFSGYISDWDLDFGSDEIVSVPVLNHANELNNIVLQTVDEVVIDNSTLSSEYWGIKSDGIGGIEILAQTFTMVGNKNVSGISLFVRSGFPNNVFVGTVELYTGDDPNALGTFITDANVAVTNYLDFQQIDFIFPVPVALTNTSEYTFLVKTDFSKSYNSAVYPLNFKLSSGDYAGGVGYQKPNGEDYYNGGADLAFIIWEDGENTKVPFNSYDPSQIAREVIDFARSRGAHINYDADSIADTGTEVSYTFNVNTIYECLNKIVELCPGDWYWTYHPGSHLYSLQPRSETPQRFFTKMADVVLGKFRKSIARIVNRVYFTGGGDPALLVRVDDTASQLEHRLGIAKLSDQRVTDPTTAVIMGQAHIDRYKNPEYIATMTVSGNHYEDIENIQLGEMVGFINFGDYIDDLELQIVGLNYKIDVVDLDLGTKLPKVSKRIEDIKRNLDTIEQQNNPDAPD